MFLKGVIIVALVLAIICAFSEAVGCKSNKDCTGKHACIDNVCQDVDHPSCPENSHFVKCGSTCHKRCGFPVPKMCNKRCFRGCVCDEGYILDENDQCIKEEDCHANVTAKAADCSAVPCNPGYECIENECVWRRDCPLVSMTPPSANCLYLPETDSHGCLKPRLACASTTAKSSEHTEEKCGEHAHMSNCTNFCPTIHCGNLDKKIVCFSLRCGSPGCVCDDGYIFKSPDKSLGCVKRENCTEGEQSTSTPKTCGPNEDYTNCGTACEPTCGVKETEHCTLQCIVGVCQCKPGYYRHPTKGCVTKEEC